MKLKPIPPIHRCVAHPVTAMMSALVLIALSGCAESKPDLNEDSSGTTTGDQNNGAGGSGGTGMSPEESGGSGSVEPGTSLLTPFVGTFDLTGPWNGIADDEALLVIREPMDNGVAEVVIYDFLPEPSNCYSTLPVGTAKKEPVGERVFLDRILQFDDAVLWLSGSTLIIDYFDTFDFDGDGDAGEQIRYRAGSVAQMEPDIQPICP